MPLKTISEACKEVQGLVNLLKNCWKSLMLLSSIQEYSVSVACSRAGWGPGKFSKLFYVNKWWDFGLVMLNLCLELFMFYLLQGTCWAGAVESVFVWSPEVVFKYCSSGAIHMAFWDKVSTGTWCLPIRLGSLVSAFPVPSFLCERWESSSSPHVMQLLNSLPSLFIISLYIF